MSPDGQPVAILTVRAQPDLESTELGPEVVKVWPPGGFVTGKSFVILIHGFNDSYVEARYFYAALRQLLTDTHFPAEIIEFHWPGNVGKSKWVATEAYFADIGPALKSGGLLAKWIEAADPEARFVLLGHSMGCRVVLSAIKQLRTDGQLDRVTSAILMAAAVPESQIDASDLGPNPSDQLSWLVLHSSEDDVLKWAFPLGESAGGQGFFPRAVGRFGHPQETWRSVFGVKDLGYGHSDYWFGGSYEDPPAGALAVPAGTIGPLPGVALKKTRDNQSVDLVARVLGAAPAAVVAANVIPTAEGPPSNTIPSHAIARAAG